MLKFQKNIIISFRLTEEKRKKYKSWFPLFEGWHFHLSKIWELTLLGDRWLDLTWLFDEIDWIFHSLFARCLEFLCFSKEKHRNSERTIILCLIDFRFFESWKLGNLALCNRIQYSLETLSCHRNDAIQKKFWI